MTRLASFLALSAGDRRLLVEAAATVVAVRVGLRLFSIDRLRAWASRCGSGTRAIERIAWSVRVASRVLPGTTCLSSAFALQRLLSAHGHSSELHIGVARNAEDFEAHAWLTYEGRILVGEEERDGYTGLVAWTSVEPSGQSAAGKPDAG
jgi:hypothetical protein